MQPLGFSGVPFGLLVKSRKNLVRPNGLFGYLVPFWLFVEDLLVSQGLFFKDAALWRTGKCWRVLIGFLGLDRETQKFGAWWP